MADRVTYINVCGLPFTSEASRYRPSTCPAHPVRDVYGRSSGRFDEILDAPVRLVYSIESVADCESSKPCGQSRDEFLISDTVMLGNSWLVLANND